MAWLVGILVALILQRIAELVLAKRNEAWARSQGAVEHGAGHYPLFFVLHISWLVAFPLEAIARGPTLAPLWWVYLGLFATAQGLRYWAISSLGKRWNTRILVVPDLPRIQGGPYRFVPHPNYVAVILELAIVPLIFGAYATAVAVTVLNAALLFGIRIPAENRALAGAAKSSADDAPPR